MINTEEFYKNTIKKLKLKISNMAKNSSIILGLLLGVISFYEWGNWNISIIAGILSYIIISRLILI